MRLIQTRAAFDRWATTIVSVAVAVGFFGALAILLGGIVGGLVMTLCTGSANWLLLAMVSVACGYVLFGIS